jgi:serine protease Do
MRKWMGLLGIAILVLGFMGNGYLYMQQNQQNRNLRAEISALKGSISTLQNNLNASSQVVIQHTSIVKNAVSMVEPTVVRIDINGAGFRASGSGFIIKSNGYVLTNQHVIDNAVSIKVTLMQGDTYSASLVGSDANRDLALLKMDSNRSDFPEAKLGSTSDIIVGDGVMAAGFPLGFELSGPASFTVGIVSAVRILNGLRFIQSDVATNPGSSGGCLFDLDGVVIGITTEAVLDKDIDAELINLSIPIDEARVFIDKWIPR